ncbi:MAG: RsmD family RNA methyltransferase, partial [Cyanobium sp.]
ARVRLAVMNLLAAEVPGCDWLDLCSGSGVMACEALQRGARRVVAIEQNRRVAAVARANLEAVHQGIGAWLDLARGQAPLWEVHCQEVGRWLAGPVAELAGPEAEKVANRPNHFDLIYADPPYASGLYETIANGIADGRWLKPGGTLVWECASNALPATPAGWKPKKMKRYGSTSLLLLKQTE